VIEFGYTGAQAIYVVTMPANTGVAKIQERTQLKCYPNPAMNEITFDLSSITTASRINIYNAMGNFIQTAEAPAGTTEFTLQTAQLQNGVYFYEVTGGAQTYSGKMVIIK
jgi:hypothetical protein